MSVRIDPSYALSRGRYGLEQLLRVIGLPTTFEPQPFPTIYYGGNPRIGGAAAIWIPAERRLGYNGCEPQMTELDGVLFPSQGLTPTRLWHGNRLALDIAQATAFWLTLESEKHVADRDQHGRTPALASILARHGRLHRPPVLDYADLLARRLGGIGVCHSPLARWPNGKRYAAALTHDVDAPERPSRLPRLIRDLLFGARPRRDVYWELRAEIGDRGLGEAGLRPAGMRREWDFQRFCELEQDHGLRSAFYFCVAHRSECHPCDTTYRASRRRYRRLYRRLLTGGWEVGLHAGYATGEGRPAASNQYLRLAELAGAIVAGVRHHYLRLDPGDPISTLALHDAAGAIYDTSVGFNDAPGFRAGIPLPFHVFNTDRRSTATLIELPMTIADMHLPRRDETAAIAAVREHLQNVKALGGLAVLNWHVGNWHAAPAWRESYRAACRMLADDPDAWVARPRDVAAWLHHRAEVLS